MDADGRNNNRGAIAACYQIAGFSSDCAGVLLAKGAFKVVMPPKAVQSCVYGVSNNGKIAGDYSNTSGIGGTIHGFLLVGKTYTTIDYPGAVETDPFGVNNSGVPVGQYSLDGSTFHGFTWQSGTFTNVDVSVSGAA